VLGDAKRIPDLAMLSSHNSFYESGTAKSQPARNAVTPTCNTTRRDLPLA